MKRLDISGHGFGSDSVAAVYDAVHQGQLASTTIVLGECTGAYRPLVVTKGRCDNVQLRFKLEPHSFLVLPQVGGAKLARWVLAMLVRC